MISALDLLIGTLVVLCIIAYTYGLSKQDDDIIWNSRSILIFVLVVYAINIIIF